MIEGVYEVRTETEPDALVDVEESGQREVEHLDARPLDVAGSRRSPTALRSGGKRGRIEPAVRPRIRQQCRPNQVVGRAAAENRSVACDRVVEALCSRMMPLSCHPPSGVRTIAFMLRSLGRSQTYVLTKACRTSLDTAPLVEFAGP